MASWIVPIVFLALPFVFLTSGLIWKSQLMFFIICPIFIIAMNIKNVWVKSFLLYVTTWQIAIFILNFNRGGLSTGPGLTIIISLMAAAVIYKFVSEGNLPDEKWATVIRIAILIQILISIPQPFGLNPVTLLLGLVTKVEEKLPGHLIGTLGNRNYLAAFIAAGLPFFIGWRTVNFKGVTINPFLISVCIFLFGCFSPGTLAAIMGLGFYLSYKYKPVKRIIYLSLTVKAAVAYAAIYILSTGYHMNEFQALPAQLLEFWNTGKITLDPFQGDVGRFSMWMTALSKLSVSWNLMLFGYGPAAFWGREYPIHSQYISVWFQFGLIGVALMAGYIVSSYRVLSKKKELILLTSLVIISLDMVANFSGEIAVTGFMITVICGLIERKRLNG